MSGRARRDMASLGIKALYTVGELASAAGVERRHLRRLLTRSGVELLRLDTRYFVSLSDLELKVRPLWDGIKAAQALARSLR